jgi:hypothetical protein
LYECRCFLLVTIFLLYHITHWDYFLKFVTIKNDWWLLLSSALLALKKYYGKISYDKIYTFGKYLSVIIHNINRHLLVDGKIWKNSDQFKRDEDYKKDIFFLDNKTIKKINDSIWLLIFCVQPNSIYDKYNIWLVHIIFIPRIN